MAPAAPEHGQLDEGVALVGEILGEQLVGVYLHGSAALGGLRPRSDLDLLAVTRRPTTREERRRLVERLLAVSAGRERLPRRPVELTVVAERDVRPWRYPPRMDFQYGEWLRAELERGDEPPPPAPSSDLAVLLAMTLLADRPLLGPPPGDVLDPVPHADLVRSGVDAIDELRPGLPETDTRNVLLTLARIWTTAATGEIHPKDAAADWALARLPAEQRCVLAHARAVYLGEEEEEEECWDGLAARLQPHFDHVVREIERLAAGS